MAPGLDLSTAQRPRQHVPDSVICTLGHVETQEITGSTGLAECIARGQYHAFAQARLGQRGGIFTVGHWHTRTAWGVIQGSMPRARSLATVVVIAWARRWRNLHVFAVATVGNGLVNNAKAATAEGGGNLQIDQALDPFTTRSDVASEWRRRWSWKSYRSG